MGTKKEENKNSISKQLTKTYLLLFPFFILIVCFVAIMGSIISHSWLANSLPAHQYNVEELLRDDIYEIDLSKAINSGGGGAVVYEDGTIKELGGHQVFDRSSFSRKEWTAFLTEVANPNSKEIYSIAYDEKNKYWLVVSVPISVRLYMTFVGNTESAEFLTAVVFYISVLCIIFLILILFTWFYAKKSARTFVSPLRKLCDMVNNIKQGNYDIESNKDFKGEFLWLSNDIHTLSFELEQEKRLRENLENNKRQMLLGISHDLRNPLATIMGYAETLSTTKELDPNTQSRYAETIFRNSVRANSLMNDLFTYTKLDSSDFNLHLEKHDICEFTREQVSFYLSQFEIAGMETEFVIPETEINLLFDEKLLARAFANLFNNCIKYNKAGIKLTLTLTQEQDFVQIMFADNGIGMEERFAETVFEPFVRADESRNSKTGGSGLGLAIVKKIISAHNGSISLDTSPNKGCIFILRLI